MAALMARRHEPDAAQALFQAFVEMATGKPAGVSEGALPPPMSGAKASEEKPKQAQLYAAPEGTPGIALVARNARILGDRMGQPDMKPFDQVLFEHTIRLMGFHGAPSGPAKVQAAPGAPAQAPIDPDVRSTLRGFLASRNTQVYAVKALAQLGDMETAKEIIENPGKYPDASISDFGANALEQYKIARKTAITQGKGGGEAAFWQSTRIPPQHQDSAVELAMSGDGGAIMATQRNWVVMNAKATDLDTVLAEGIDATLRFPGSRAAWVGQNRGIEGFFTQPEVGPKTYAMMLKAVERDLQIIFSGKPWFWGELKVLTRHEGIFNGLWHHVRYGQAQKEDVVMEKKLEALFRQFYRPETYPDQKGFEVGTSWELAIYAAHLNLKPLEFEGKRDMIRLAYGLQKSKYRNGKKPQYTIEAQKFQADARFTIWQTFVFQCESMGEIKSVDGI